MKLKILLLFAFVPFIYNRKCEVSGELSKYSYRSYYPRDNKNIAYYIDTWNFGSDRRLYFKTTITYGRFSNGYLDYQGYDYKENTGVNIYLNRDIRYDRYSSGSFYSTLLYKDYTYYFIVDKPSYRYLYVAAPDTDNYDSLLSTITVYSTNSFGISVWVWIGIGAFVLVVIILSIVIYRCKRAQREAELKSLQNPAVDPIPLNANPVTDEPNQNSNEENSNPIQPPTPPPYVPNPNVYAPVQSPYAPNPSPYAPNPSPYAPNPSPYAQPPPGY